MKAHDHRYRSGSEPVVRSVFTRELCDFFDQMILPAENWPGMKNEDLIHGIVEAVVHVAKQVPDGMGIGMLHTLAYSSLDAAERQRFDEPVKADPRGFNSPNTSASHQEANYGTGETTLTDSLKNSNDSDADAPRSTESFEPYSPLFAMGYTVAQGALSEQQRREILKRAISISKLSTDDSMESKRWGQRNTSERLRAVANHLFFLARFQGSEKLDARDRWMADLDWLRTTFSQLGVDVDWSQFARDQLNQTKRTPNAAFMKPLTPSKALALIVGAAPLPRTEVTKKVWEYIKIHNLQDGVNKRMINADKKLLKIFGKSQASMFEMTKLVNEHLR